MDFLFALLKGLGFVLQIGLFSIVIVVFVAALINRIPWVFAYPIGVAVSLFLSYSTGVLDGVKSERGQWETAMEELRIEKEQKRKEAEKALSDLAAEKLASERTIAEHNRQAREARQSAVQAEFEKLAAEEREQLALDQEKAAKSRAASQAISYEEALAAIKKERTNAKCSCKNPLRYRVPDSIRLQLYKAR